MIVRPDFLFQDRKNWPLSRDFVRQKRDLIPAKEKRKRFTDMAIVASRYGTAFIMKCVREIQAQLSVGWLADINSIMWGTNNLKKVRNVLARICRGLRLDRSRAAVCESILQRDLQDAEWWLGVVSLYDLKKHVTENKMTGKLNCGESLNISWSQGLPVAKGRMGHGTMKGIIGHSQLKVLSGKSRLAHLLIMQCHEEDHRLGPQDAVFRSIRQGYLVLGARRLAIKVLKDCYYCKRVRAKQRMDSLPPQIFEIPVRPWTNISLDFVAPMLARDDKV